MEFFRYWGRAFAKAWRDADFLRPSTAAKTLLFALLPLFYLVLSSPRDKASASELILLTFVAYVAVSGLSFAWNLLQAPVRLDRDMRERLETELQSRSVEKAPQLRVEILRVALDTTGPPPLKTMLYLNVTVKNDGGPTTLRDWSLKAITENGAETQGMFFPFYEDLIVPIAGLQRPIIIPVRDAIHTKTGNVLLQRGGEVSGFVVFMLRGIRHEEVMRTVSTLQLSVAGAGESRASADYDLRNQEQFPPQI